MNGYTLSKILLTNNQKEIEWNERKIHELVNEIQAKCGYDEYLFDYSYISPWSNELSHDIEVLKRTNIIQVNASSFNTAKIDLDMLRVTNSKFDCNCESELKAIRIINNSFIHSTKLDYTLQP